MCDAYRLPRVSSNRFFLGAACLTCGGRSKGDDWVTEAESGSLIPHDFDKFPPSHWVGFRNKCTASQHIETWEVNATSMSKMFSLIYGSEWIDEMLIAIGKFRRLHIDTPQKFTLSSVRGRSGALARRRGQELRDMANI